MKYRTFVTVGNATQPFARMLKLVEAVADVLPAPVLIQAGHTPYSSERFMVIDFLPMDSFLAHIAAADVVISHGGATVIQALACGKIPVVISRERRFGEHVDDHQVTYAARLAEHGKVRLAVTAEDLRAAVSDESQLLRPPQEREIEALRRVRSDLESWSARYA